MVAVDLDGNWINTDAVSRPFEARHALSAAAAVVATLLVVSGCTKGSGPLGTVRGVAQPCEPTPQTLALDRTRVSVELQDGAGHLIKRETVGQPWSYTFTVRPGIYLVSAPREHDRAVRTRVRAGASTQVSLVNGCK